MMLVPTICSVLGASVLSDTEERVKTPSSHTIFAWEDGATISRIINMYEYLDEVLFGREALKYYIEWTGPSAYIPSHYQDLFRCNLVYRINDGIIFFRFPIDFEPGQRSGFSVTGGPWISSCVNTWINPQSKTRRIIDGQTQPGFCVRLSWLINKYFGCSGGRFDISHPWSIGTKDYFMVDYMDFDGTPDFVDQYERVIYETGQMKKSLFLLYDKDFLRTIGVK